MSSVTPDPVLFRAEVERLPTLVSSGPAFRQLTAEGRALRVWFDHTGGGLRARDGDLKGFAIAGKDGKFVPAGVRIENQTVVVSNTEIKEPAAVRSPGRTFRTATFSTPGARRPRRSARTCGERLNQYAKIVVNQVACTKKYTALCVPIDWR